MSLQWPAGFTRTPAQNRERTWKFGSTRGSTTSQLAAEMERLDPDDWRCETGSGGAHTKKNGLPKTSANPDDPGFVLRWSKDGSQFAVACDRYARLDSNMRAVLLWVRETRLRGDRPVETGEDEFATARLPSGDEDAIEVPEQPHEVLGVAPDADDFEVRATYYDRVKEVHPDQGGSAEQFQRVQQAQEQMLEDASAQVDL